MLIIVNVRKRYTTAEHNNRRVKEMTKTFEIPFHGWNLDAVYKVRVTDREEERDTWKRVVAQEKALKKFKKEFGCHGNQYMVRSQIKEL
jgi:hypothetical protein